MCGYEEEGPRLKTADLRCLAEERAEALRRDGVELHPVQSGSRKLAEHFWGSSWMKHLARCEAGGLCLAPGRSLLRHGAVLDLRIGPGCIEALLSAEELYEVRLALDPLDAERLDALKKACNGHIDSLVSLLEGKLDAALLQQLCAAETGLLPEPQDWHMSCSCPDWSEPCPHEAAAIYAAGLLIDADPSLLFLLRQLDTASLLDAPSAEAGDFDAAALSRTFCIDLDLG